MKSTTSSTTPSMVDLEGFFGDDCGGRTLAEGETRGSPTCVDCHGDAIQSVPDKIRAGRGMTTSGPAAPDRGFPQRPALSTARSTAG